MLSKTDEANFNFFDPEDKALAERMHLVQSDSTTVRLALMWFVAVCQTKKLLIHEKKKESRSGIG